MARNNVHHDKGELLDVLYTRYIGSRDENEEKRKKKDYDCLSKFIRDHIQDLLALEDVNWSCIRVEDDVYEVIFQMVKEMFPREEMFDLPYHLFTQTNLSLGCPKILQS
ncbi:hypothetical protein YC2023_049417 [Brassica napus]